MSTKTLAAAAFAALLLTPIAASAQHNHSTTVTGPNGQSATRAVTRAPGSTNATVTGPNGQTATRQRTRDPESNSASGTATGPNGQTAPPTRHPRPAPAT